MYVHQPSSVQTEELELPTLKKKITSAIKAYIALKTECLMRSLEFLEGLICPNEKSMKS